MISLRDPNEEISQSANQLVMLLLKRKCRDLKSSGDSTLQNGNSSSSLSHCIDKFKQEYFTSDSPSLRAYGVQYVSDTFQKELKLGSGVSFINYILIHFYQFIFTKNELADHIDSNLQKSTGLLL
jgi:hypothetical protein